MVILGALDLALRLGGVEDPDALAQVNKYREELFRAASAKGVAVIEIVRNAKEAREAVSMGASALLFGQDDLAMLRQASLDRLAELREAIAL